MTETSSDYSGKEDSDKKNLILKLTSLKSYYT